MDNAIKSKPPVALVILAVIYILSSISTLFAFDISSYVSFIMIPIGIGLIRGSRLSLTSAQVLFYLQIFSLIAVGIIIFLYGVGDSSLVITIGELTIDGSNSTYFWVMTSLLFLGLLGAEAYALLNRHTIIFCSSNQNRELHDGIYSLVLTVSILAVGLITFVIIAQKDDDVDPAIKNWLQISTIADGNEGNGYLLLMGFDAASSLDALQVGRQKIGSYEDGLLLTNNTAQSTSHGDSGIKSLALDKRINNLCQVEREICVGNKHNSYQNFDEILNDYQALLDRYILLYKYDYIHTSTTPGLDEPFPQLVYLAAGNRLLHGVIIKLYESNKKSLAINMLSKDISFLRRQLIEVDSLILKMMIASLVKKDLFLFGQITSEADDDVLLAKKYNDILQGLSAEERSLGRVIKREFKVMSSILRQLGISALDENNSNFPAWLKRVLYKPNATINRVFIKYTKEAQFSEHSAEEFARNVDLAGAKTGNRPWDYIFNFTGTTLYELTILNFEKYMAKMHDIDGLLSLVRAKKGILENNIRRNSISEYLNKNIIYFSDPYTKKEILWDKDKKSLYFHGRGSQEARISLQM